MENGKLKVYGASKSEIDALRKLYDQNAHVYAYGSHDHKEVYIEIGDGPL